MNNYFTVNSNLESYVLLHIPHSSIFIPEDMKDDYLLSTDELNEEVKVLADMYTDDLFGYAFEKYGGIRLDVSRVFLDVERFRDDELEPMAKKGMGLAYIKTSMLKDLRTLNYKDKIYEIYDEYHKQLDLLVEKKLQKHGKCLIIDCHSFPSKPRPYQMKRDYEHIDVCIGYEEFHGNNNVVNTIEESFKSIGLNVEHNNPYSGSMVSNKHYGKNINVKSVMIELNRKIYMDDIKTFNKNSNYEKVKNTISDIVNNINMTHI